MSPFESNAESVNSGLYNPDVNLFISAGTRGILDFFDYRVRERILSQSMHNSTDLTCIA